MLAVRFATLLTALTLILSLLVAAPATHAQTGTDAQLITLPGNAVFPEGIGYDARTGYFYVTSNTDGDDLPGHAQRDIRRSILARRAGRAHQRHRAESGRAGAAVRLRRGHGADLCL